MTGEQNVFVQHAYEEHSANLGEISMNYAVAGSETKPALLLIPGQTESWWGFEDAMPLLEKNFRVYAVDLRGQGRSTRTPERYTLDNMGNDLVRFITLVIKRPVVVSGCSSGGVLACWLSAFAMPGQIRGAHYEDPPLFASELSPKYGHGVRQAVIGPVFELFTTYLGNQWCVGDWKGLLAAKARSDSPFVQMFPFGDEPPQNMKEYDPEWARAFHQGTIARSCPHHRMLAQVKVPVLLTHHSRLSDPAGGYFTGAISDVQVAKVRELVTAAGQAFDYADLPEEAHAMHSSNPNLFAKVLTDWANRLIP